MRIAMIGTGYVGLVSGACFSDFGHVVTCIDKDTAKIAQLQNGTVPLFEPGLEALVARNVDAGRLSFTTDSAAAVRAADAIFLAVGTPSRRGDGFADLSFIYDAAGEIAADIEGFTVVALKSTFRSEPTTTSRLSFASCVRMRILRWCQIRNSCARARQSRISSIRIASWLAPTTNGRAGLCAKSTDRFSSTRRRFSSPDPGPQNSSNTRPTR